MKMKLFISLLICVFGSAVAVDSAAASVNKSAANANSSNKTNEAEDPRQSWGFVPVRPDANMFWWLYYAKADDTYKNLPLVIWLQGGPGASSTGYGNFAEIGPLDVKLQPRGNSWLNYANLLFIDNPVGSGYSYVTSDDAYVRNNTQIAQDLIVCLESVLKALPEFRTIPIFIFSESYGGKMTAGFARHLNDAIVSKKVVANLKGIALGDSWIAPTASTDSWSEYLYALSLIDSHQRKSLVAQAKKIRAAVKSGKGETATNLWSAMEGLVEDQTNGVNWYNILKDDSQQLTYKKWFKKSRNQVMSHSASLQSRFRHVEFFNEDDDLDDLMNGPMRKKLNIPAEVTWGNQSATVFEKLSGDFMNSVVDDVDYLLNSTDVKVTVYTGQLDLIVNSLGTETWLNDLTWPGMSEWSASAKEPFASKYGTPKAFIKRKGNFAFYWILQAGHMVPSDQIDVSVEMLKDVISH